MPSGQSAGVACSKLHVLVGQSQSRYCAGSCRPYWSLSTLPCARRRFPRGRQRDGGMSGSIYEDLGHGTMTAAISDAMVGLVSRYTGRGATSSWTTLGKDLIVCVMGDSLTKGEK